MARPPRSREVFFETLFTLREKAKWLGLLAPERFPPPSFLPGGEEAKLVRQPSKPKSPFNPFFPEEERLSWFASPLLQEVLPNNPPSKILKDLLLHSLLALGS